MASEAVLQGRIRHVSAGVRQVITFSEATVEDAAIIAMLNADVQAIHAAGLPNLFKAPAMSDELVAEFATRLLQPENLFLIAMVENVPAGYLFAEFQHQKASPRHVENETLYVHHISVISDLRRKGLGRGLLDEARRKAKSRGVEKMALDVWSFNQDARKFFADYGLDVYNERMWMSLDLKGKL